MKLTREVWMCLLTVMDGAIQKVSKQGEEPEERAASGHTSLGSERVYYMTLQILNIAT